MKIKYCIALCCLWCMETSAQNYVYADSIPVLQGGVQLTHPFTGGFNNIQYNSADLNEDGVKDVVIFDRGNQKILPFVVTPAPAVKYKYRPDYELLFPRIEDFVLMRDYNGDGCEDLFVGSDMGLQVYKCVSSVHGFHYELFTGALFSAFQGNANAITVNSDDYPLVQDMDGDGDLDIVCFDFYTGARLEYHQNLSIEKYGHKDSLVFQQTDDCYGNFQEIACDTFTFGLNCRLLRRRDRLDRVQHVGSGALMSWDMDHDGLEDLLIGKSDCFWINYLKNIGSASKAVFEHKLRRFGAAADTFEVKSYPVPYAVDVDGNGTKEILISPGAASSNYRLDFEASSYLLNTDLTVASSSFLQDQTIDLGENSAPTRYDYDFDGDQDLFVGYHTYFKDGKYRGGIALYENILSESEPLFSLKTTDYMGLMQRQWVNVKPQFFDINSDGNIDLLVTASLPLQILVTQTFVFYGNEQFLYRFSDSIDSLPLPLNIMDAPFFTRDALGQVSALVGKGNGQLLRYGFNGGIWSFEGQLWSPDPNREIRYTCVAEANIDGDTEADLLMSNSERHLVCVKNYKAQPIGAWPIDTLRSYHVATARSYPVKLVAKPMLSSGFAALQKNDIWVGASSGGLMVLKPDLDAGHHFSQNPTVFPNPFSGQLFVKSSKADTYVLYDYQGRFLSEGQIGEGYTIAPFENLRSGLYILRFSQNSVVVVKE